MKGDGLQYFSDTHLVVIGLVIFFVSFFMMVGLQWIKLNKNICSEIAHLPLRETDSQAHIAGENL